MLFEEGDGEGVIISRINEIAIYFVDSEEMFPLFTLGGVLCDLGVELFWNAIKGKTVVCGEDELLFEPKAFLEFFNLGEKVNDLGGDTVNELRCFKPTITIS